MLSRVPKSGTLAEKYRGESISISPGSKQNRPAYRTDFAYPKLALGADFAVRVQLMDPNEPLKHQLYVKGTGRLALSEGLNIWSALTVDVSNDFNTKGHRIRYCPELMRSTNISLKAKMVLIHYLRNIENGGALNSGAPLRGLIGGNVRGSGRRAIV